MLSTEDVFHLVDTHAPGEVKQHHFRGLMLDLGFKEKYMAQRFIWLMDSAP